MEGCGFFSWPWPLAYIAKLYSRRVLPIFIAISYRIFTLFTHLKLGGPKGIPPKENIQDEWVGRRLFCLVRKLPGLSLSYFYSQVDRF